MKFDINTPTKMKRVKRRKLTWNERLQAKGIATWSQSQKALKTMIAQAES